MATVDELINDAQTRMGKSVEHSRDQFGTVRTGRASASLLDRIEVDYYGTPTPLKQLATIGVPERAHADGAAVRPELDPRDREGDPGVRSRPDAVERRQADPPADPAARPRSAARSSSRSCAGLAEEHRVAVREIRRDAMKHLKDLVDKGEVGADEERRAEERVQKLTDEHTKQIDDLLKHKEAEVMEL